VVQLPLGVFAIAIGTASLPSFSEQAAGGDYEELKDTIAFSLRLILFVTIPAMIALIILRVPIISVLFQRGQFDAASTVSTAQALLYYAVGLWAFSCIRVIVSAFYALQDTRTPVKICGCGTHCKCYNECYTDVSYETRRTRACHIDRLRGQCCYPCRDIEKESRKLFLKRISGYLCSRPRWHPESWDCRSLQ